MGNGADGTSPTVSAFGKDGHDFNSGQVEDLPNWLHKIETDNMYDASLIFATPITQDFRVLHARTSTTPQCGFTFFSVEDK
jgi:hypothetical protein